MTWSFFRRTLPVLFGVAAVGGCNDDTQLAQRAIQGRIDSAVRARVSDERLRLQTRNDSLIVQEARRRADSLRAAGEPAF